MDRLDLKAGFTCNNRCVFCVQGDKRLVVRDRSTAELEALLAEHAGRVRGVVFTGGEVTVRRDLPALVARARRLGYETIQIQTNGRRLAYRPYLERLKACGVTEIAPALHGSRPAIHDALTRAPGSFRQTVQGIRNARALGLPVVTNSVVVRGNYEDLPALARLLVGLDVQQIQFAFVHPAGTAARHFEAVVPRLREAMPFVHRAIDVVRAAGVRVFTEAVPYCFMQGYEAHVVEPYIPDTVVVDDPIRIDDYTAYRWTEGKAHGPPCARCRLADRCEGPWAEYPQHYGWDEFEPR